MTAIEASSVGLRTMADGTLRLSVDIEPRNAQAAFRLFGSPGTAVALAGIKPVRAADPSKPKGGPLSKLAGQWCNDDKFIRFIRPIYDRTMGGNGMGWGDVTPADFGGSAEKYARHCILTLCNITSRADLDHDDGAAQAFHQLIREPFSTYLRDNP